MKKFVLYGTTLLLMVCCVADKKQNPGLPSPASRFAPVGPSQAAIAQAVSFTQNGLPFLLEIDPSGALGGEELQKLKNKFLLPLANSPHANKILKVSIDASALEWFQWTCRIDLKDDMNPISMTHFGGLYDGESNTDPDAYRSSRPYVLNELDKIAKRAGW